MSRGMMTSMGWLLALAAPALAEPAAPEAGEAAEATPAASHRPFHVALRWGMDLYPDAAFEAIGPDRSTFAAEYMVDVQVVDRLSVGLMFHLGLYAGELYGEPVEFQNNRLHLSAAWRQPLHPVLDAYARLGPTVGWYGLTIGDGGEGDPGTFDTAPWQFGARAALGLEFWPADPHWIAGMGDWSLGLSLEVFYDHAFHDTWRDGGVDLGRFDPSALGWTLGIASRF